MYTREEAIEKVLEMRAKLGHMPTEMEYETERSIARLKDLVLSFVALTMNLVPLVAAL